LNSCNLYKIYPRFCGSKLRAEQSQNQKTRNDFNKYQNWKAFSFSLDVALALLFAFSEANDAGSGREWW